MKPNSSEVNMKYPNENVITLVKVFDLYCFTFSHRPMKNKVLK